MTTEPTNVSNHAEQFAPGLHVLAKPIGPVCDIKCDYCFSLEAHVLLGTGENYGMPDDVLATTSVSTSRPGRRWSWSSSGGAWNGTAHRQVEHAAMPRFANLFWQGDDLFHRPDGYLF